MSQEPYIYPRTAAYQVHEPGTVRKYYFWTIDPTWGKPGSFYIREHQVECFNTGSMSKPIAENLSEREAFEKIAELERAAARKYPLADDKDVAARKRLGDNYFTNAKPFRDCYTQAMRDQTLATLRERRARSGLKFKPK